MNCRKAIRQLPAYLDRELTEAENKNLQAHLEVCVFCSTELSALRAASKMLDSWVDTTPRRFQVGAVIKQIRAQEQGVDGSVRMGACFWTGRFWSIAIRAAAVIVFLIGFPMFTGRLPVDEPTPGVTSGVLDDQESLRRLMALDADVRQNYIKPSEFWLALRGVEKRARPVPGDSWEASVLRATRDGALPEGVKLPVVDHIYLPGEGMPVESIIPVGGP